MAPSFTSPLAESLADDLLERFLRYVRVDTQSARDRTGSPSTPGQLDLARMLVAELKDGNIAEYTIAPQDFGLGVHDAAAITVQGVEQSKALLLAALGNEPGAARDIVAFNAGASIYVAGLAPTLAQAVQKAIEAIESGAARKKLDAFVAFTRSANG